MNTAVVDGDSAYNQHHGVAFDGFSIPYVCIVGFRPANLVRTLKKAAKFGTTSMPGFFTGYTPITLVESGLTTTSSVHWKVSKLRMQLIPVEYSEPAKFFLMVVGLIFAAQVISSHCVL